MISLKNVIVLALTLALALPIAGRAIIETQGGKPTIDAVPSFAEPAISPDRSEIAFVSGGDIWTVPAFGGEARLLVSHPANESRPLFSPDGRRLAFISNRTGGGDIYVLGFDSGETRRLTFDDGNEQLDSWSRDGRWIYFTSSSRDISGMNDLFRVSVDGGTPMQVSADRYASEYFSTPSPDGKALAFTARGVAFGQWWRKGRSHLDECEIWVMRDTQPASYEQITDAGAKDMWPMWSADGKNIYYVSDRGGAQNIWMSSPGRGDRKGNSNARQITKFKDGRVLWPNISYDGRTIVFERNFAIWKLDTASGQSSEVPITRRGAPAGPSVEHLRLTDQIQELALSPDGKKVAFVVRGEVFAASAKDGGDAARVTNSPSNESQITWAPDSRKLAYVSDRDGVPHIYTYDFASNAETQLTRDGADDAGPTFSPDGKSLAFERNARELRVVELESKQERLLASGTFERPPLSANRAFVWSPDNKWIAYTSVTGKSFVNVFVVPSAGGEAKQISFLANVFNNAVSWSPDGTFILFDSAQRTEDSRIARIDLIPRTPRFREDQFRDLFKEESPRPARTPPPQEPRQSEPQTAPPATSGANERKPSPKPVEIVFEDIRKRLSLLPVGVDAGNQEISPDGKWLLMIASGANQQNLYIYSLDELAREPAVARQLTSTAGFKRDAQFSPDGKEVFYLEQGRINVVALDARAPRPLAVSAEMDVDFAREKIEVFNQAWAYLRDYFYDPNFHGVDWKGVRAEYAPRIAGARTPDEMRRLLSLMVGELNASHSGVSGPFGGNQASTGKLGLRFDRFEYEATGRLRVTEVIPLCPAALAGIRTGEYLLAIDGTQISTTTNLDQMLGFKIGKRVSVSVASSSDGANKREVAVRPVNTATEKGLLYRKWVEENRAYVGRISGGRLGYVHMFDMGSGSLSQLFVDLDTENHSREGVVVDVRNNNGGFVNAYAIDVLARRGYMTMTRRGFPAAPARTVLGQRSLEAPTILVTNQHSLSDAEDFTEGYRALKLGKVVGEPTGGWIIYTANVTLIDGTSIRLPFIKIESSDGKLMELAPRPVDVSVVRPVGESYSGHDAQLETAVKELLKQIGNNHQ
ncbi:MAG TPA: DPP IV N-terminal domain-containing protein [Blastocatellia bacterium]|nr:DPP IV N-terminal domain-containing protein [Blastocatellia bacterium]